MTHLNAKVFTFRQIKDIKMKTTDYLIVTDKSNPKGLKQWILHFFEFFLNGMIFGKK